MAKSLQDLKKGDNLVGDNHNPSDIKPAWYCEEKFQRGRDFFNQHKAAIVFSMHCSLVAGFSIINLLEPLVFTRQSDTGEKAFKRYLLTFYHIYKWMTEDIWDRMSEAYQSLEIVRNMHGNVARRMSAKKPDKVYVSQYDMGLVQSGFFGAVLMYPKEFGIKCSSEELADYVFVWRVIGYKLGIHDDYNICRPELTDTMALVKEIEQKCLIPALLNPPKDFQKMADAYIDGTNKDAPISLNSIDALLSLIFDGLNARYPKSLGLKDTVRYYFFKILFFLVYYLHGFEKVFNYLFLNKFFVKFIWMAQEEFKKQKQRLQK